MKFTPVRLNDPAGTSTARRGILSIITIGLQGMTRFASNWLIGMFAGKAVFGIVANATALSFFLNTFWPSSAQGAASKFIARARGQGDDDEIHAVAWHVGVRVLQVSGLLALAAPAVWAIQYRAPLWEGVCVSAMILAVAASQFARGVHFGAGQIARGTRIDVITSVIGVASTGLMLALGVRSIALTLPLTLAMGVYAVLCWPWTAHGRPDRDLRAEIDKFVTFAAMGSIASAGMLQVSQLTAGSISAEAGGQYAPALQLVTPLAIVAGALTLVLFPTMAEAQGAGDVDRLRRTTDLATRGFAAILVPIYGAVAIAARPIMQTIWLGRYPESALLMPSFAIALLLQNVAAPAVGALTSGAHRNLWYSMTLSWVGFAAAGIIWAVGVPRFGVLAVAVGYAIGAAVTSISLMLVGWRLVGQRWWRLMAGLMLAVAAIGAISSWRLSQPYEPIIDLACALAFAAVSALFGFPTLRTLASKRR